MCAARNPGYPQGLPLSQKGTGLSYARRLHLDLRKADRSSVRTFEFEVAENRRNYPRLPLQFPLRIRRVAGQARPVADSLVTQDISSTGVYFLAPMHLEQGAPVELEIGLTDRPRGRERVRMRARARVVRVHSAPQPGWHGVAVTFDEIAFDRDDPEPAA